MSLYLKINNDIQKEVLNFQEHLDRSETDKKIILTLSLNYKVDEEQALDSQYLLDFLPYFKNNMINNIQIINDNDVIYSSNKYHRIETSSIGLPDGEGEILGSFLFINNLEEEV